MTATGVCGQVAAAAVSAYSRNVSSADWSGANLSAISPICRTESDSQHYFLSACYISTQEQNDTALGSTGGDRNIRPLSAVPMGRPQVDQNDSDLTMTTMGSVPLPPPPPPLTMSIARPQALPIKHIQAIQKQRQSSGAEGAIGADLAAWRVDKGNCHSSASGSATTAQGGVGASRRPLGVSATPADPFPEEMSVVGQDDSRSSSPRSLLSGAYSCWTQVGGKLSM